MENNFNFNRFQQAAISYVGLGVVIVLITTFFIPSSHYRSGFIPLLIGIVILLVISYFLFRGVKWLAYVLSLMALGRTAWWAYSFIAFGDEGSSWVYVLNALLNSAILFMLIRAILDTTLKDLDGEFSKAL